MHRATPVRGSWKLKDRSETPVVVETTAGGLLEDHPDFAEADHSPAVLDLVGHVGLIRELNQSLGATDTNAEESDLAQAVVGLESSVPTAVGDEPTIDTALVGRPTKGVSTVEAEIEVREGVARDHCGSAPDSGSRQGTDESTQADEHISVPRVAQDGSIETEVPDTSRSYHITSHAVLQLGALQPSAGEQRDTAMDLPVLVGLDVGDGLVVLVGPCCKDQHVLLEGGQSTFDPSHKASGLGVG